MKTNIILIGFLVVFSNQLDAQTVVSSCLAPDSSAFHAYAADAQHLAERRVYADSSTYRDSAFIPALWTDSSLQALMAVYNADSLLARDSVVIMYPVHAKFFSPVLRYLTVYADSTLPWIRQLALGHIPTGTAAVDTLLTTYHFSISYYINMGPPLGAHVELVADTNYNIQSAANRFSLLNGVTSAYPNAGAGDMGDILDSITPMFTQLTYIFGWGDCEAGCINRHHWIFRVYHDCSVQFVGSGGDFITVAPITAIPQLVSKPALSVYPNPGTNTCTLQLNRTDETYSATIIDATCKEVMPLFYQQQIASFTFDVQSLASGLYFVKVTDAGGHVGIGKFVKE